MNILQIASNMKKNGPAMVVYDLSWGLAEIGHKVFVAAGEGELVSKLTHQNIEFIHIPIDRVKGKTHRQLITYVSNGLKTYKQLKKLIRDENIEIINSHQPVPNLFAKLLSKTCKIPFVTTSHNIYQKGFISNTYVSGDHVVAVSQKVYENSLNKFNVPKEKITCIPNGINPDRLATDNPINYAGKFVIGTLAGLRKQKALDKLIFAFSIFQKAVPEAMLVIAGSGEEENKLRRLVQDQKLDNNVDFLGFRNDTANVLSGINLFALSSEYEGLPISMLEAMAMRIPVVVTAVGGIPEVITDGENGLLCKYGNYKEMAQKFFIIYKDIDARSMIAEKGYETVLNQFDYHIMANSYFDIYKSLLN